MFCYFLIKLRSDRRRLFVARRVDVRLSTELRVEVDIFRSSSGLELRWGRVAYTAGMLNSNEKKRVLDVVEAQATIVDPGQDGLGTL